jgi:anti-anti-sigma factor
MVDTARAEHPNQGDAWYLTIASADGVDTVRLSVSGRIGTESAPHFEQGLLPLASEGRTILLDLARMDYISSAGFRVLERMAKTAASAGGRLAVQNLVEPVRLCFDLAGPIPHLTIERSQDTSPS